MSNEFWGFQGFRGFRRYLGTLPRRSQIGYCIPSASPPRSFQALTAAQHRSFPFLSSSTVKRQGTDEAASWAGHD